MKGKPRVKGWLEVWMEGIEGKAGCKEGWMEGKAGCKEGWMEA